MTPVLYVVLPCYNEEEVLPKTLPMFIMQLYRLIEKDVVSRKSCILCVDDGSRDDTWSIICDYAKRSPYVKGVRESRNNGHQNALMAGMMEAMPDSDIVITMDCDGQDDLNVINQMVYAYLNQKVDIVYGVRSSRKKDTCFKRWTAQGYYKLLKRLGADVVYNHADCRLLSKRVLEELVSYQEVNLFLRGLFPLMGFKTQVVYYERQERFAGETKYPLHKMFSFGMNGVTSLSVKPLTIILSLGFVIAALSFFGCLYAFVSYFTGYTVPGWASMMCIICLVCGIQLICLGVIGIYVGKIYLEVKHRPRYIISERVGRK